MYDSFQLIGETCGAVVVSALCAVGGATVLSLRPHRVDAAEALVTKYNRRAAKIGSDPIRLNVQGTTLVVETRGDGHAYWGSRSIVTVHGVAPRIAGWRLVARIEHTEAGNLVSRAPIGAAHVDLVPYREAEPICDHCGHKRNRRDTFVLEDESGTLRQVGRNCLADFIRSEDLARGLPLWTLLHEISASGEGDDEYSFGGSKWDPGTLEFLTYAVAAVRVEGFAKSGSASATKNSVYFAMGEEPKNNWASKERWTSLQPTEADAARALVIRQWATACTDTSDYLYNLRIACTLHSVQRNAGLLASAPTAYGRAVEREIVKYRQAPAARPVGKHVGAVGSRLELGSLTVIRIRHSESDWGPKAIVTLVDAESNEVTWFATGAGGFALNTGDVLDACKATIKRHDEYKGRPQTTISRLVYTLRSVAA